MADQHMPPAPHGGDRFVDAGEGAVEFVQDHFRSILVVLAAGLLASVGWVLISQWHEGNKADDQARVAEIALLYPGTRGGVLAADLKKAIEQYEAFIAGSPTETALAHARLNLAMAYEEAGEAEKAKAAYEALRDAPELYAAAAAMRLGYMAAAAGETPAATAAFEKVIRNHPGLAPPAALEIGVLAEAAGETEAAIELYRTVMRDYALSPQASEARARIRHLGGDPDAGLVPEVPEVPAAPEGAEAAQETGTGADAPAASEAPAGAAPEGAKPPAQ